MKEMRCRDVGMNCDFVARGSSEQEVMDKAAHHARSDHGMQTISPELAQKVRGAIHDV